MLLHVKGGYGTPQKKKKKNHLCVCLCGWSPAWSRAGFSQVCCDLTGPLTGGTVNIRLSCDSRCSSQEAQKGQCLLMPLPTSKLSDFISPLVQPSHFKRTRHWRCCITSPRAQRAAWNTHPSVRGPVGVSLYMSCLTVTAAHQQSSDMFCLLTRFKGLTSRN